MERIVNGYHEMFVSIIITVFYYTNKASIETVHPFVYYQPSPYRYYNMIFFSFTSLFAFLSSKIHLFDFRVIICLLTEKMTDLLVFYHNINKLLFFLYSHYCCQMIFIFNSIYLTPVYNNF